MNAKRNRGGLLPFLDLLFILLFSLLALSETRTSSSREPVRIRLPNVEPGESDGAPEDRATLVLEIDADSNIRLRDDDAVIDSPGRLDAALARALAGRAPEECQVEIHGDANASHGVSVALLQHLRNKGFAAVTLLATGDRDGNWAKGGTR